MRGSSYPTWSTVHAVRKDRVLTLRVDFFFCWLWRLLVTLRIWLRVSFQICNYNQTLSSLFDPSCREFEDLLNNVWCTIVTPGAWLSFDEQMIKSTAAAMRGILRFNPLKPIKHGECGFVVCEALCLVVSSSACANKSLWVRGRLGVGLSLIHI